MLSFKVGDWVIHNGEYKQVTKAVDGYINSLDNKVAVIMKEESLELWTPELGEWCWFYDNETDVPTLAKLISINKLFERKETYMVATPSCISKTSYNYSRTMSFARCQPFIGQLPSNLKDL